MKVLLTSLLLGLAAGFASAVIMLFGAVFSDTFARIAEVLYTPSAFIARLIFAQSGRSTIYRDIAFILVTQWLIYSALIYTALALRQRYKHRHDNAAS